MSISLYMVIIVNYLRGLTVHSYAMQNSQTVVTSDSLFDVVGNHFCFITTYGSEQNNQVKLSTLGARN